jgi:lipid-binding SYLF domain-containing protein
MRTAKGWPGMLLSLLIGAGMLLPAAATAASLDSDATAALGALYKKYPAAQAMSKDAKAIVIFPSITKVGLMIGGESGNGVMRVKGKSVGYYNNSGVSSGLQAGAQKYGYALFLMTDKAVSAFGSAQGFEVGVGPSVVLMDEAQAAKKTTTTTAQSDIYAYIFGQKGLMAGLGIQGNKITKIDKPK